MCMVGDVWLTCNTNTERQTDAVFHMWVMPMVWSNNEHIHTTYATDSRVTMMLSSYSLTIS